MKNLYGYENELKVNRDFSKNFVIPHISVTKKPNRYSCYTSNYRREAKSKDLLKKYSSRTSIGKPIIYFTNYQRNKTLDTNNNHLLFDSNKQKIIKTDNNNYIRFISNKKKYKKYNNLKINDKMILSSNYLNFNNNVNNEDKYERTINMIKSYSRNNTMNNSRNNTLNNNMTLSNMQKTYNNFSYNKDNPKDKRINKSLNICTCNDNSLKIPSIRQRNHYIYNISNNKTEVSSNNYTPNHSQSANKNIKHNYLKTYLTDYYNINETKKKNINNIKNRNFSIKPISSFTTKMYSYPETINNDCKSNQLEKKESKDNFRLSMPMKLNIVNVNKEKLSRIKSIIEKSSKNCNSYQLDIPKNNLVNKLNKSVEKRKIIKKDKEIGEKFIFKKKKIMSLKEKNKEGKQFDNNILITSSKNENEKHKTNSNLIKKIKNHNQIQSSAAAYNLFVHKNKNNDNLSRNLNIEEIYKEQNDFKPKNNEDNNMKNNNDEDTITLSYSKESISISSKNKKNEEKSILLPFFTEQFHIYYDIYNKQLIINDKNCFKENKNNKRSNELDDDDYLLTKEILLLKNGLTKKSELNKEIKRKLRELLPIKIANFSLFGHKKIYRKKTSNYKSHRI